MPKNKGGKKFKKGKKFQDVKMIYKDTSNTGQLYGLVKKNNGNGRAEILCEDGANRLGILRGSIRHRCRLNINDIIIICPHEFQDSKGMIIHKYNDTHRNELMRSGECVFLNTFDTTKKTNLINETNICPFSFKDIDDDKNNNFTIDDL